MPRKKLIRSAIFPYHITARANNREAFPGDLASIWNILSAEICVQACINDLQIHALVLMPNHYHLIASSPGADIGTPIREFQSSTTRIINTKYHRWGRIYGSRYQWSIITEASYYFHALKYVYRNPIKAGLCKEISEYEFSTAYGLLGYGHLSIPLSKPLNHIDSILPSEFSHFEAWLNHAHTADENNSVRFGLRRKIFEPPVKRSNRKLVHPRLTHPPHQK